MSDARDAALDRRRARACAVLAAAVLAGGGLALADAPDRLASGDVTGRAPGAVEAAPVGTRLPAVRTGPPAPQSVPYHPYDGSWTFVRIRTMSGFGRLGRLARYAGWAHDYPDAERNFSQIMNEFTAVRARMVSSGGNVLTFQDPRLHKFPIAYVSEPDEWQTNEAEAAALREYLLKGGFVIFDDFFKREMPNLVRQMARVFPELRFLPMDGSEEIWHSFFSLEPTEIVLEGPRKNGTPDFYGLYENNDKSQRMYAIAGAGADIGDLWEWSHRGFYPVDPTNEAYGIGINYIIYAFTH